MVFRHAPIPRKGSGKQQQQQHYASVSQEKMKEHFSSKAHKLCVKQEEYHACDAITKSIDKMNERYIASTCRVFNTVYSLAKRCRPFSDIKNEIELQIRNGVDMGVGLHSRKTAVKIVDHIQKISRVKYLPKSLHKT